MRKGTILALGWACAAVALSACVSWSDPFERERALEMAQKRYTEAIRWGDFNVAARYVDPALREQFLAEAETFESVRITDYELGDLDITDGFEHAEGFVTYRGYVMPQYLEKRVRDRQVWYRDVDGEGDWRIRPEITALLDGLGVRRAR